MDCLILEELQEEGGKQVVNQTAGLVVSIAHVAITHRSPGMDDAVEDPVVEYWRFVATYKGLIVLPKRWRHRWVHNNFPFASGRISASIPIASRPLQTLH